MDSADLFKRNLLALSERNVETARLISQACVTSPCVTSPCVTSPCVTSPCVTSTCVTSTCVTSTCKIQKRYEFRESRGGELIPALIDSSGAAHPLHSMMDPKKEAKRLINSGENSNFVILLGLGGGYCAEAALERDETSMTLVIEYDSVGLAELFSRQDYTRLFSDPRFRMIVDPSEKELSENILNLYQPVLSGGIRVIPLRSRTSSDQNQFIKASEVIEAAIKQISADYSVQAHFGKRWFSNIVQNLVFTGNTETILPELHRAAVIAAGPSLSVQIKRIRERRKELFIIATDTSLPCLLHEDLAPDAVISIDCQHISYYHFMNGLPEEVLLFLDLASPPMLSRFTKRPHFFLSAHPLTMYISQTWKAMPRLDTSGGNVTYAAISLAEQLGAREIELYGADFSYPAGASYARGTYIYAFFEKYQNRFLPMEAQSSAFLFRTPLEKKSNPDNSWYYETETLKFYREKLEEKSRAMEAIITPIPGLGAPIGPKKTGNPQKTPEKPANGKAAMDANEFLIFYRNKIAGLPKAGKTPSEYFASINSEERSIFTTILPAAAAIKQRSAQKSFQELLEEVKAYCVETIDCWLQKN